ncbi:hypothetical protein [Streptomyces fumanus]|uniref:hypothetical protein n=1 Tax=Streptomyces fumanus TaxID=67302 RepID=UPI0033E75FEF
MPGAHPRPNAERLDEASMAGALEAVPGAGLIVTTERFDVVLVPRQIGMAAMVLLDRDRPVTCLIVDDDTYALFVLPATGRYATVHGRVEVRTGPEGWVALPPSRGVRWDTPPWIEATTEPRKLLRGDEIRHVLADCFTVIETGAAL